MGWRFTRDEVRAGCGAVLLLLLRCCGVEWRLWGWIGLRGRQAEAEKEEEEEGMWNGLISVWWRRVTLMVVGYNTSGLRSVRGRVGGWSR